MLVVTPGQDKNDLSHVLHHSQHQLNLFKRTRDSFDKSLVVIVQDQIQSQICNILSTHHQRLPSPPRLPPAPAQTPRSVRVEEQEELRVRAAATSPILTSPVPHSRASLVPADPHPSTPAAQYQLAPPQCQHLHQLKTLASMTIKFRCPGGGMESLSTSSEASLDTNLSRRSLLAAWCLVQS